MGLEHLTNSANPSSGFAFYGNEAMEEMKRLQGLRAETLKETCQSPESRDGAIRCPIPCKSSRWYRDRELRAAQDLSDFILSKASPPYFMGSPPVRATNPLVHDAQFCAWKVQGVDQSIGIPIPTKGYNARYCGTKGSITKA
ncbi:hypothetical protein GQ55_4G058200 [Panicum hallii var. hallii]|uniref:Uncharacterized protein n=3 Tax=Panicum hallii TaxID=206008 RepID=A0A2T7DVN1_9POAL|nr:uncharacterized protein LOC112890810 [Panicum hallii]PAN22951.1 hypothetical protein PAHAL_4G055400 [Panicum hallii]PAN22952.1 hypothetical protein PAHAL_4G055400 [Panicum hallii]PUZ59632.1 hypothetical protein GQ55_4G058200 [Panicum hallii var. hallii]PUZ59634.1 hypothetical protein GQ55_4G058200 [Panicum hallii var. hallii]